MSLYQYPEFHLLSEFLKQEDVASYHYPIHFREESDADNRFALSVSIDTLNLRADLLRKLAIFFGCPAAELPEEGGDGFEASDNWHGLGGGNLRELADEIAKDLGEGFFDFEYTVGEIHRLGALTLPPPVVTCVYCGLQYPEGTPTSQNELLTAHIKVCDKHPMRAAEAELKDMRDKLVRIHSFAKGLIGTRYHANTIRRKLIDLTQGYDQP